MSHQYQSAVAEAIAAAERPEVAAIPSSIPTLPAALALDAPVYKQDLQRWLRVSRQTVWRLIKDGTLPPPVRLGSMDLWPAHQIRDWAIARGIAFLLPTQADAAVVSTTTHRA